MRESHVAAILKELGWTVGKDEVGDRFCQLDLGDRQLRAIPTVRKASDHLRVTLMPSISTRPFSDAVSYILGGASGSGYEPLVVSAEAPRTLQELSREDVGRISGSAVSWAKSQDIEKGLETCRNLPTDSKGAKPLRHLAALALAKDHVRLESYKHAFEMGDRLGFVPYIKKEMIDRALTLARGEGGNL